MLDHCLTPGSAGRSDHGYSHDACQLNRVLWTWASFALWYGYLPDRTDLPLLRLDLLSYIKRGSFALLYDGWYIVTSSITTNQFYCVSISPLPSAQALQIGPSSCMMCDYTQVQYKCSHLRYVVRAWCTKYQETHKRCPANVVAM
jgi:hypothetical protein